MTFAAKDVADVIVEEVRNRVLYGNSSETSGRNHCCSSAPFRFYRALNYRN